MKNTVLRSLLICGIVSCAPVFASSAIAVNSELRMMGLAMHRDTGRNIYLGALHLGIDIPNPDNLVLAPAPKAMEYRVVARRTSMRSLLGNMLLQSEVANAMPPNTDTINFADALLSTVQGSLYSGDSFVLELDEGGKLNASLNGVTLVERTDDGVFGYLLNGWIGQNSPSTSFRGAITTTDIDSSLLSSYSAHIPTNERINLVSEWSQPLKTSLNNDLLVEIEPIGRPIITVGPAITEIPAGAESAASIAAQGVLELSAVGSFTAPVTNAVTPSSDSLSAEQPETDRLAFDIEAFPIEGGSLTDMIVDVSAAQTIDGSTGVTSERELSPEIIAEVRASEGAEQDQGASFDILSLDLTEYSHRLAGFNSALVTLVYSQIKYPRRAVRRNIQGALELDITLLEDGSLIEVAIAESSGYSILDVAAVEAAQKALNSALLGKLDPIAIAEYSVGGNLVIPVPVNFILQ